MSCCKTAKTPNSVPLDLRPAVCTRADGGRQGAPTAVQLLDRYHLLSNLSDAVERDVQQMQIQAGAALRQQMVPNSESSRLTLVEARRQRCREARY